MKRESATGRRLVLALALVALAALAAVRQLAAGPDDAVGGDGVADESVVQGAQATSAGAAGVRVYLDPETGEMRNRPTDAEGERSFPHRGDRLSTYGGDLIEEPLPGGGFKVDLRGRFQSAVVATIDPQSNEIEIDCVRRPVSGEVTDDG